jgi:hypothetical protein
VNGAVGAVIAQADIDELREIVLAVHDRLEDLERGAESAPGPSALEAKHQAFAARLKERKR